MNCIGRQANILELELDLHQYSQYGL